MFVFRHINDACICRKYHRLLHFARHPHKSLVLFGFHSHIWALWENRRRNSTTNVYIFALFYRFSRCILPSLKLILESFIDWRARTVCLLRGYYIWLDCFRVLIISQLSGTWIRVHHAVFLYDFTVSRRVQWWFVFRSYVYSRVFKKFFYISERVCYNQLVAIINCFMFLLFIRVCYDIMYRVRQLNGPNFDFK